MDKLDSNEQEKGREEGGLLGGVRKAFRGGTFARSSSLEGTLFDVFAALFAFLFARSHIIFGSHPLSLGFIAVLPSQVWLALFGSVIGSLTLGKHGIIYAMISVIVVFLRIIVSGTEKNEAGEKTRAPAFSESLLLRMSASVIGGFISAVYEVLLSGFSLTTMLFGLAMLLLPPLCCFGFSGLFDSGISFSDIFYSDKPIFSLSKRTERDKFNLIFFQGAALLFMFLLSLSLKPYELLGINAAYIYAAAATLFVARRFGAMRATAVGFATTLGLSSSFAAAFALAGLVSGALFKIGLIYALLGGGVALVAWSAYSSGLTGLVSTLPEYAIAAALSSPLLKRLSVEKSDEEVESARKLATEMVGTMALSFKTKRQSTLDSLESSLSSVSSVIKKYSAAAAVPTYEELSLLVRDCMDKYCRTCDGYRTCPASEKGGSPTSLDAEALAQILKNRGRLKTEDLGSAEHCGMWEGFADSVNLAVAELEGRKYREALRNGSAEEFDLISKLISEARKSDERECSMDSALSDEVESILDGEGLSDGVARVFGDRIKHVIIAAEDESGAKISSPVLKSRIEQAGNARLGTPDFFRRGRMALMECTGERIYSAECATASVAGEREAISGDTARAFETSDGYFFTLISDGMGSGEEAKATSGFVCDLLLGALDFGAGRETALKLLNHVLLSRSGECSATVDLFSLDLYKGEAVFIKSGAAPSYIKRGGGAGGSDSIFRIRSRTAPMGVMREPDAERIRAQVESEDIIIMLSDGISQSAEDSPWLLELLAAPAKRDLKDYADLILQTALKNVKPSDDMTVAVTRVRKIK